MSARKRWSVLGLSLALAGALLALTAGLLAAAGGLWTPLGPDGGGVVQLAAADTNPTILYARTGDVSGQYLGSDMYAWPASGIWKSSDGGSTWHPTALGVDPASGDANISLGAMAISADGTTVCAAQIMQKMLTLAPPPEYTRMWCSTDSAKSWRSSVIPDSTVRALAVLNKSGGRVVAGSAAQNNRPLFYSNDNGRTWRPATVAGTSDEINIYTLAEGSAYAGGEVSIADDLLPAVFTSADGITWRQAFTGTTTDEPFTQIVADPTDSQRAYALAGAVGFTFVYSTADRGQSWVQLNCQPGGCLEEPTWLAVDRRGRLYASTVAPPLLPGLPRAGKVYRSADHGVTWGIVGQLPDGKGIDSVVVDPSDDDVLYVASGEPDHPLGVYRTPADAGVSAASYEFQPTNQDLHAYSVFDVAGSSADPSVIYAATWGAGVLKSEDGGSSWRRTSQGANSSVTALAVSPRNPDIVYMGVAMVSPVLDPAMVYRSTDGGSVWEPAGAGLDLPPPGTVADLAIDPSRQATLYAAGAPGGLYKTTNSGRTWQLTTLPAPAAYGLAIHPTTPNTLYVAVNNAPSGVPALYKSTNGGTSWNQLAVGVGQDCMSDVLINPNAPNEVYAVGCSGTFLKSTNDGTNWTTLSLTRTFGTGNFPYDYLGLGVPRLGYDGQADRLYIAYGPFGLLVSQDRGATWTRRTADDVPGMALYSLFYQPATGALYLGGSNGLWQHARVVHMPAVMKN